MDNVMLAQYKQIADYVPSYGDLVFRAGWINSAIGVISNYDKKTDELYIIFSSLPLLLLTMTVEEQAKNTEKIRLDKLKDAPKGKWAIQQHDKTHNAVVWYI